MAKTATTRKTFADLVAEADLKAAEKADKAITDLVELRDRISQWTDAYYEAAARVQWLRGAFSRGQEAATPAEFAEALAAEERARLLAGVDNDPNGDGTDRRIKAAERNLPAGEKRLASAVALALEGLFPGVQILSTFGKVESGPEESDLPVMVVSQSRPTYDGTRHDAQYGRRPAMSGLTISGDVTLTLYRLPIHREIYGPKLAKHLAEQGVQLPESMNVPVAATRVAGEYEVDELRLAVDQMSDPSASPELKQRHAEWLASRRTTLVAEKPVTGWDLYAGVAR
ncbi:hypothetical protein [Streptomyces sp. NPDC096153]|uniref:hypothetical protein n=1 Tax=Streptomyces sp. NPDC096153 TaxID=3155548 RepID=UPI003321995B